MLKETIALYNKVRDARASLEKQASVLKYKEEELKASMLAELNAVGVDSISESGYTIFKKHNVRAEITDHASLQEAMYQLMTRWFTAPAYCCQDNCYRFNCIPPRS